MAASTIRPVSVWPCGERERRNHTHKQDHTRTHTITNSLSRSLALSLARALARALSLATGMDEGPVVAGMQGRLQAILKSQYVLAAHSKYTGTLTFENFCFQPRFHLLGPPLAVAALLESQAEINSINMSNAVRKLLAA